MRSLIHDPVGSVCFGGTDIPVCAWISVASKASDRQELFCAVTRRCAWATGLRSTDRNVCATNTKTKQTQSTRPCISRTTHANESAKAEGTASSRIRWHALFDL